MVDDTIKYGLTHLPADQSQTRPATSTPKVQHVADLQPPTSALAERVRQYAQSKLSPQTYNHSLRVYSYGRAIANECFPTWNLAPGSALDETWFLTAMLHDIGTASEFLSKTHLSFEFWGGYHALELLQHSPEGQEGTAPTAQAESVAEAIIRHQDIQNTGQITLVTRLIHLGTLLDNVGASTELVHPETIHNVVAAYDRKGWSSCFHKTVEEELRIKPYAMVGRIDGFLQKIDQFGQDMGD